MKVVDLNLLLYAVNSDAPNHEIAREWLGQALSDDEPLGLAWVVILGFLRISTRPGLFARPLTTDQAIAAVQGWLDQPNAVLLYPGQLHWQVLRELLEASGTAGNLTTDAHIAALAIEYGATLYSTDRDFRRFAPMLRFENPVEAA